mmetsp:Transcript_39/g.78  ORF Transcript_39/g.78 Transcript_39/m.78 type:complete len:304 (-) Transcript_39:101-1012(-)
MVKVTISAFLLSAVFLIDFSTGFQFGRNPKQATRLHVSNSQYDEFPSSRRTFMKNLGAAVVGTTTAASFITSNPAFADDDIVVSNQDEIEVYFGCGCFWHVQHEFVEAERKILGRSDSQITSRAGYAGGKAGAMDGKVCYHNAGQIADYGKLGHAEVVRLQIPKDKFEDFAVEYFNLFDNKGDRPDQFGDRGPEYRNLVGVPGGTQSEYAKLLVSASVKSGDKLDFAKGRGDDPDARAVSFVMDTADYPFFVAEQYHQFHDGFNLGENYPGSYNGLAGKMAKTGTLGVSNCPNGLLGIGALGL